MPLIRGNYLVATDCVLFTILHDELKLLLIKRKNEPFKGKFALPGGHVEKEENLEDSAARELEEETGVKSIHLQQLKAYGDVGRDPRGRVITVAFLALVDGEKIKLQAGTDAEIARWFSAYELPELAFDHHKIVKDALHTLRQELQSTKIASQFMPKKFTLSELQKAYEVILDTELDKRNFRKKLKELKILKELNETRMEGAHRPAKLHSFR